MTGLAFHDIHVIQGEQAVSDAADATMQTVLGSCVSACLHDPVRGIGGMNHFLLPDSGGATDIRYASAAMEQLVNALLKRGAARERLQAKLFGGARIMPNLPDIGRRNGEAALAFLSNEGIACKSHSLGGAQARRIRFWPATGRAQQLLIDRQDAVQNAEIARERPRCASGSIELF
ncbi:chemotaxis protein CheD [Roseibacterium sp. SDUM158017]|uniref:chemotaxis protein CheD n=1 Tax=Roseicyclus salinarum TaxID=3036773 RepID=UPI002414D630|nr:chemotaxis protein CheD [Roseibacterium sp. SDUM158017]MDG4649236.1 chemotaxis protein CheD [Roseibacterium sp. SDUM158017]